MRSFYTHGAMAVENGIAPGLTTGETPVRWITQARVLLAGLTRPEPRLASGPKGTDAVFRVVLAGEPVLSQHVAVLATMLGDHSLAQRLNRGLVQRNSIVALSTEDRELLLGLLDDPPSGLAGLQSALLRQRRLSPRIPRNY